jgi:hypothetical protein
MVWVAYWSQHEDFLNDICVHCNGICVQVTSLHKQVCLRCTAVLANYVSVVMKPNTQSLFANNDTKLQTDINLTENSTNNSKCR